MGSFKDVEKKCKKEVEEFIASSVPEIRSLNLQIGQHVLVKYVDTCAFTNLTYVTDEKYAEVVNNVRFKNSAFDFCLYTVDDYGNDCFINPEYVKFIEKRNSNDE